MNKFDKISIRKKSNIDDLRNSTTGYDRVSLRPLREMAHMISDFMEREEIRAQIADLNKRPRT